MFRTFLLLFASHAASAGIIVSNTGPSGGAIHASPTQAIAMSWSQSLSYTGVDVQAVLLNASGGNATFTAWLTDQIGPGTTNTPADVIATASFVVASGTDGLVSIFSGLTLGPGTFFLVLVSDVSSFVGARVGGGTIVTDAGASLNPPLFASSPPAFAPSDTFNAHTLGQNLFTVTGNVVPEPSTFVLAGLAFAAVGLRMRRAR